jgi:8-oxo-dGTP pyrophosphatase MutT (NUDIX family)/phosphohistidine phosphatase SixA
VSGQGRPEPSDEILAAGALLYTCRGGRLDVAVIHRPKRDDWTFAKGKLEPGEHVLAAAVREVTEETGIRPVLGPPLATVRYRVEGRPKRVDYWAARVDPSVAAPVLDGRVRNDAVSNDAVRNDAVPNAEVDVLDWLAVPEATARLSYPHDVRLLERLVSVAGAGASTATCILLRHASAGRKSHWPGDDLLRPLDSAGRADAEMLADVLACYAPQRVISSATERCLGTVRPYAERIGVAIEAEPAFTMPGDGDRAAAARRRMTGLIAGAGSTVVCAHRENLPVLLDQALAVLGEPGPGGHRPERDWSPPKSGFWVLHMAAGKLVALEHHDLDS